MEVRVFAPVNIAWIKYMGKENGLPTNSSLSMTLNEIGTHTRISFREKASAGLAFQWDSSGYVPDEKGRAKAEAFLKQFQPFREVLEAFGFECMIPAGEVTIFTQNNVPAGTGIATSASAFAALTLAWSAILAGAKMNEWIQAYDQNPKVKKALAEVARKGSGSACRSFNGPWVEWSPRTGISTIDRGSIEWADIILLIDEQKKSVSSSEAHERVKTSPLFKGRSGRVEARLAKVKAALKKDDVKLLKALVLEEALDMHELFHTAETPFSYLKPESERWLEMGATKEALPKPDWVITLDAGANVHFFVPAKDVALWTKYIDVNRPGLKYVIAKEGKGARFES